LCYGGLDEQFDDPGERILMTEGADDPNDLNKLNGGLQTPSRLLHQQS